MYASFLQIVRDHRARYPLMQPQDYGKLAFQSEYGPKHLAGRIDEVFSALEEECGRLPAYVCPEDPEEIGGGFCRVPLSAGWSEQEKKIFAKLLILTAEECRGSTEGMKKKTDCLLKLQIPGMDAWIDRWNRQGYPVVHHSEAYRSAYRPHYRLLQKAYAGYFPLFTEIAQLLDKKEAVVISIDGRCGSGKSRLAGLIKTLFCCNVIHTDDFYLSPEKRCRDWEHTCGGNMDFERIRSEVLAKVKSKQDVCYRPFCCREGKLTDPVFLPHQKLTVIEGSYSQHPKLLDFYDQTIFLTCEKEEQMQRLQIREGSYASVFQKLWIPMEERYIGRYAVEENCRWQIDTSDFFDERR